MDRVIHRCKRCGRLLTTEKSVELGYGSVCFRKFKKDEEEKPVTLFDF